MNESSDNFEEGFPAILHGPEWPGGASCRVIPRSTGLEASMEGRVVARLDYRSTAVTLAGVDDRYICFEVPNGDKGTKLLVPDRSIVAGIETVGAPGQLLDQLRQMTRQRLQRRVGRSSVLLVLSLLIIAVVIVGWLGFDWAMERAVGMIPAEWEVELGRTAASGVLESNKVCADPELLRATQELGTRLVGALSSSPYSFRLRVVDSEEVNAFALPGGYIFVNRGLIEQSEDAGEVAGVLAHEIQHVIKRHGLRNMVRQAGLTMLLLAAVGDTSGLEQFILLQAADLATMSFSRDQEREADRAALDLLRRARLDPEGLPRFLARLATEEGTLPSALTMISTHPASDERVRELRARIAEEPAPVVEPLRFSWDGLSDRCSPVSSVDPDAPVR